MKALLSLVLFFTISTSALAADIICKSGPGEIQIPEEPIIISLGHDGDKLSVQGEEPIVLKHSEKDRLVWDFELVFIGATVTIDARNNKITISDGADSQSLPIYCEGAEEAEFDLISKLLERGKLEAAGMKFVDNNQVTDTPRGADDFVFTSQELQQASTLNTNNK